MQNSSMTVIEKTNFYTAQLVDNSSMRQIKVSSHIVKFHSTYPPKFPLKISFTFSFKMLIKFRSANSNLFGQKLHLNFYADWVDRVRNLLWKEFNWSCKGKLKGNIT